MTSPDLNPHVRRLALLLGWPELPERTRAEQAEWRDRVAEAERDRVAYYGERALEPVTPSLIHQLHGV